MDARVLVVDDEKLIRWSMTQALEGAGYVVEQAETAAQALAAVEREAPDLVLLDFKLPDRSGTEIMPDLLRLSPSLPVIMITAHASIPGAVQALKEGVLDYIGKPFEINELLQIVSRVLEANRLREVVAWHGGQALKGAGGGHIVAKSPAMREVMRIVQRVAEQGALTVLLLGESGVGKGIIARALHYASSAGSEPFMNISCTSLPDQLLESELFGHEKGAFTDAKARKKGLVELADQGTVFLDEIGDLNTGLQAKLLGFLEDRVFRRVGGVRDIHVSVRVLAATNKDLEQEVAEKRFRRDLFYRLKVIPIRIPPLRERQEDLPDLVSMFVQHFNEEFGKAVQAKTWTRPPWRPFAPTPGPATCASCATRSSAPSCSEAERFFKSKICLPKPAQAARRPRFKTRTAASISRPKASSSNRWKSTWSAKPCGARAGTGHTQHACSA